MKFTKLCAFAALFLLLSLQKVHAQINSQSDFYNIIALQHDCGEKGLIHLELINEDLIQAAYWQHDYSTALYLDNLDPGTYTLVIVLENGCIQEADFEILDIQGCEVTLTEYYLNGQENCIGWLELEVFFNGQLAHPSSVNVEWVDDDGYEGNDDNDWIYDVYQGTDEMINVCVTVIPAGGNAGCCFFEKCLEIGPQECVKQKEVIVNEMSVNESGKPAYLELLVLGNNICGEKFDLRGFHIDDNNGYLIPANDFVDESNVSQVGIDPGFLTFSHDDNWEGVPNGSLILIIQEKIRPGREMPELDEYDSNGDNVYVLSADNSQLLYGSSAQWNEVTHQMDYIGLGGSPSWQRLSLADYADGIQVRYPDGSYCHGISRGITPYAAENNFELWITQNNQQVGHCSFMNEDYNYPDHFTCNEALSDSQTPGSPNSQANAELIDDLRFCIEELASPQTDEETIRSSVLPSNAKSDLVVYPNPFSDFVSIEFTSDEVGETEIFFYTPSGKLLLSDTYEAKWGRNYHRINLSNQPNDHFLLLKMVYPSGQTEYKKVVQIKS